MGLHNLLRSDVVFQIKYVFTEIYFSALLLALDSGFMPTSLYFSDFTHGLGYVSDIIQTENSILWYQLLYGSLWHPFLNCKELSCQVTTLTPSMPFGCVANER